MLPKRAACNAIKICKYNVSVVSFRLVRYLKKAIVPFLVQEEKGRASSPPCRRICALGRTQKQLASLGQAAHYRYIAQDRIDSFGKLAGICRNDNGSNESENKEA